MEEKEKFCSNCEHYWRKDLKGGQCRRLAPVFQFLVPQPDGRIGAQFGWPPTGPTEWCGKFKSEEEIG